MAQYFLPIPTWILTTLHLLIFPLGVHSTFLCAPDGITKSDYDNWTNDQKLEFGICWDSINDDQAVMEELEKRLVQMEYGDSCSELDPTWNKIRPGIGNTDYYDEFHEEVPITKDLIVETDPPRSEFPQNARLLTTRGFMHVYKLLTTNGPFCDTIIPEHMPLECREGKCVCKTFYPGFGNDYTVHFTEFRDRRTVPISLEYNAETKKCAFPIKGQCKVQPNEDDEDGYMIPCPHADKEQCLIVGNDFPCDRHNVMKTLELYNIRAHNAKERYVPFRLHYPIPCKCSTNIPKLEGDEWPEGGIKDEFIYVRDYDEDEDGGGYSWKGANGMIILLGSFLLILFN